MLRRLLGLLIALSIGFALPSFGSAAPSLHAMAAKSDCACPNAADDCGEHGTPGCKDALACAVQCGAATPMLGVEIGGTPSAPFSVSHLMAPVTPLISAAAAPPYRPPTVSILA